MTRNRTLAEQSIEQSIVEESAERARRGGSRTLAQHALDQEAREILARRRCLHCEAGIVRHDDGMHRSLGWEIPCPRAG